MYIIFICNLMIIMCFIIFGLLCIGNFNEESIVIFFGGMGVGGREVEIRE